MWWLPRPLGVPFFDDAKAVGKRFLQRSFKAHLCFWEEICKMSSRSLGEMRINIDGKNYACMVAISFVKNKIMMVRQNKTQKPSFRKEWMRDHLFKELKCHYVLSHYFAHLKHLKVIKRIEIVEVPSKLFKRSKECDTASAH